MNYLNQRSISRFKLYVEDAKVSVKNSQKFSFWETEERSSTIYQLSLWNTQGLKQNGVNHIYSVQKMNIVMFY